MRRDVRRRHARATLAAALVAATHALALQPRDVSAQLVPATLGFAGGLIGGAYVTTGLYVLKSRATGWRLHSAEELVAPRIEALPVVAMPIGGALLGARDRDGLAAAATWGGVGLLGGAAIGAGMGQLIWGGSEGRWAGGTIGSAAGLAIGAVVGALTKRDESEGQGGGAAPWLSFSIPMGGG